jgi:hypothetical protein
MQEGTLPSNAGPTNSRSTAQGEMMDYVDWCDSVFQALVTECLKDPKVRTMDIHYRTLAATFGVDVSEAAVYSALSQFEPLGLVEHRAGAHQYWNPTTSAFDVASDMSQIWQSICQASLPDPEATVLAAINQLSVTEHDEYANVSDVTHDALLDHLGWDNWDLAYTLARDLRDRGHIGLNASLGRNFRATATYSGVCWETRRGFTIESAFIDELVAEWETTSVDFKRELDTKTADDKAGLTREVLSLANTQASGRRWLIIGFDDKTRKYYGPPSPKLTQNHFEHLMKEYTEPMVTVRYESVAYRKGTVGKLEVIRDPLKLPYRATKSIGSKKRIETGKVYVRHGSQVEEATPAELQAIQDEGDRARSLRDTTQ